MAPAGAGELRQQEVWGRAGGGLHQGGLLHTVGAGFIGIPRKIMALKNLKAIIIDLNYIKGILFFLDLTGE